MNGKHKDKERKHRDIRDSSSKKRKLSSDRVSHTSDNRPDAERKKAVSKSSVHLDSQRYGSAIKNREKILAPRHVHSASRMSALRVEDSRKRKADYRDKKYKETRKIVDRESHYDLVRNKRHKRSHSPVYPRREADIFR